MLLLPEANFRRTPVTLTLMAIAMACELAVVLGSMFGVGDEIALRMHIYNDWKMGIWLQIWRGELWRPFTTTLLHANLLHALFNVYGCWLFGAAVENWQGSWRFFGLVVLLAYVSSMAEFVGWPIVGPWIVLNPNNFGGLVGFSGVNYGLFGFVWMCRHDSPDCAAACTDSMVQWMMGWLVVFVALTTLEIMPVANIAHAAGLLLGILLGKATVERNKLLWIAGATALSVLTLGTMFYCPWHPLWR